MKQVRSSQNTTATRILSVSRKHSVTYVLPVIAILLALSFLSGAGYIIGVLLGIFGVTKILANKSTSWVLTDQDLIIKSGFLPWKKIYFEIPKEDIYEALYSQGLLANLFGYGTLTVRRTEGTTSTFSTSGMAHPKDITAAINTLIRESKKDTGGYGIPKVNTNFSIADELQKLLILKNQGLLNEEEFNSQKQKLINSK